MQWELSYLRPRRSCAKYKQTLFKNLPKHYPKHPENPASYGTPFRIHWIFFNNWLKFYLFTYLFFLAAFGSSLLCAASLGAVSGGATLCRHARAPLRRAQAPGTRALASAAGGLSNCDARSVAPQHVESSQTSSRTCVPCTGKLDSYRCDTRQVLWQLL